MQGGRYPIPSGQDLIAGLLGLGGNGELLRKMEDFLFLRVSELHVKIRFPFGQEIRNKAYCQSDQSSINSGEAMAGGFPGMVQTFAVLCCLTTVPEAGLRV